MYGSTTKNRSAKRVEYDTPPVSVPVPHLEQAIGLCRLIGRSAGQKVENRETAVILLEQRTAMHVHRPGERITETRSQVASVRPDVFDGLDQREGIAGLDARLRQQRRKPPGPTDAQQKLLQICPDHCLAQILVVVRRLNVPHLGREGPELVAKAVAACDREILKRLVPAAAGISSSPERGGRSPVYLAKTNGTDAVAANRSVTP